MAFATPPPLVRYAAATSAWVGRSTTISPARVTLPARRRAAGAPPRPLPHMDVRPHAADSDYAADAVEDENAEYASSRRMYGAHAYFAAQDAAAAAAGRGPPRDPPGAPMRFRLLVVGSGDRECALAKVLHDSNRVHGLYYCPDEAGVCAIEASKVANSTGVSAYEPGEIVRFCRWALVDAVFVGPDRGACVGVDVEEELASSGITVFGADVGGMLLDGLVSVDDCVQPLVEAMASSPDGGEVAA
ncbi:hypothetical protein MMPV_008005 [Pyropia vietnamensis]